MPEFTYAELMLTCAALDKLLETSQFIANDRSKANTKENRGLARTQVKTIRGIMKKLDKELEKYPEQSFEIIDDDL